MKTPILTAVQMDGLSLILVVSADFQESLGDRPQIWSHSTSSLSQRAVLHLSSNYQSPKQKNSSKKQNQPEFPSASFDKGFGNEEFSRRQDMEIGSSRLLPENRLPLFLTNPINGNKITTHNMQEGINSMPNNRAEEGVLRKGAKERTRTRVQADTSGISNSEPRYPIFDNGGLEVSNVQFTDNGFYRCRVDFLQSQTRNNRVNLKVIVPPTKVEIFQAVNSGWKKVEGDTLGPLNQDDSVKMKCITSYTSPSSWIVWLRDNTVIDATYEIKKKLSNSVPIERENLVLDQSDVPKRISGSERSFAKKPKIRNHHYYGKKELVDFRKKLSKRNISKTKSYQNKLLNSREMWKNEFNNEVRMSRGINYIEIKKLTREDHSSQITCAAANTNITKYATKTITISLALPVLNIQMDVVAPVKEGDVSEVQCTVWGSHPPPKIRWSLDGLFITASKMWVSDNGNVSVSVLAFSPSSSQDGKTLTCTAFNSVLLTSRKEGSQEKLSKGLAKSTIIEVHYLPRVKAWLGKTLDGTKIKEGDDVYFECAVKAKPKAHSIAWMHQGKLLMEGPGVLISNMTLVLQKVNRSQGGKYVCKATNTIGSNSSKPETLDVKFAPVCASDQARNHTVGKYENSRISCDVHANPPNVSFTWTFNNSAEVVNVPDDRYMVEGLGSLVNYTPMTELDYGTLLCWARNSIGKQVVPCVFQIVAAGKPEPPHNCHVQKVTLSSLQVSCLPGDNGGDLQNFRLQVMETVAGGAIVTEVTSSAPTFTVANLKPATAYRLVITANNRRGESKPAHLTAQTEYLHPPRHETSAEPTRGRESNREIALGVIVGAVLAGVPAIGALLVVLVKACIQIKRRKNEISKEDNERSNKKDLEEGDLVTQTSPAHTLNDSQSKDDINEETQRLLKTAESSPLHGTTTSISAHSKSIDVLNNSLNAKLAMGSFIEAPVPPPIGYNEGYSPLIKIASINPRNMECSCTMIQAKTSVQNKVRKHDFSEPVWTIPTQQQRQQKYELQEHKAENTLCHPAQPLLGSVNSCDQTNLAYMSAASDDQVPRTSSSVTCISAEASLVGESPLDVTQIYSPFPFYKGPKILANTLPINIESTLVSPKIKKPSDSYTSKESSYSTKIREISFPNTTKSESSV